MPEENEIEQQPDQLLELYKEVRDQNEEIISLLKTIRDKKPESAGNAPTRKRVDIFRIGRN